jgi:hypothetical protein
MSVWVYFKRKKEDGIFLPNFEVHASEPEVEEADKRRVHALEDGECIYGGKFHLSDDRTFVYAHHYRVSNIGGQPLEEELERYTLPRWGK